MVVGDVEDQNIGLLSRFERAALGGQAEGVGGVDGGKSDGFGELDTAVADGQQGGCLHAAGGVGGHGEAGTEGYGGIAIDEGAGNAGGRRWDDGDGRRIGQEADLRGGERMLEIEDGGAVGQGEADPVLFVRLPTPDAEAEAERTKKMESFAVVREKVEAESGGEIAAGGALELRGVEAGLDFERTDGGGGGGIGRGEGAESRIGTDDADGGGAVGEGELENPAGEGGVGGSGDGGIDKSGHDDGAVDFDDDSVARFGEIIDTPGLADTDDAAVADENRTVGDDS